MFFQLFLLCITILQPISADPNINDHVSQFGQTAALAFNDIKRNPNACCTALRNLQPTKIFTPDPGPNYVRHYQFYETSPTKCLSFKIRADKDAHIALVGKPKQTEPMIEIVIAGWGGTKSVIRKWGSDFVEKINIAHLNDNDDVGFWITWNDGKINVGKAADPNPFMTWTDPQPFDIKYFGLSTCGGSSGLWTVEEPHCPNLTLYQISMQISRGSRFEK